MTQKRHGQLLRPPRRQQGAALIVLAAMVVLGTSWLVLSALNNATDRNSSTRSQNGEILKQAKEALIGYIVNDARNSGNPGKLPCPEPVANAGGSTEGEAGANCSLPAIGRLPWKTLGLRKLLDNSGQPLWYVVSANWATPSSGSISINSNTAGQLTVDGVAGSAVALIIAPGEALNIQPNSSQSAAGCAARNQSSLRGSLPPDYRDFIECQNSPVGTFVTSVVDNTTNAVLNDQMTLVRTEEFMPFVEGVVARRMATDIAPAVQSIYASASWGTSATNPLFPFAAPFGDPSTATYEGTLGTYQGLAPFTRGECTPGSDSRCDPSFVQWISVPAPTVTKTGGTMSLHASSCSLSGSGSTQVINCTLTTSTTGSLTINVQATASNVGMSLRELDVNATGFNPFSATPRTATGSFNADGSARITFNGSVNSFGATYLLGVCLPYGITCKRPVITIPVALLSDPSILNPGDATAGWFTANGWHQVTYYAISPSHAPNGAAPRSCSGAACLSVLDTFGVLSNPAASANGQRALLILAGRRLTAANANIPSSCVTTSQAIRPSATRADYLECVAGGVSNSDADLTFVQARVGSAFNDRFVLVDQNP